RTRALSTAIEGDKHAVAARIGRGSSADRIFRDERRSEAAADAAEIVAIKEIRSPIFAERQDERFGAPRDRCQIQEQRVGAAEIRIARVEFAPVRGGEEILWLIITAKVGRQAKTASPSLQVVASMVLPVAMKSERPSLLMPPGAQIPPPQPRVLQVTMS